jgi:hypothetical protein
MENHDISSVSVLRIRPSDWALLKTVRLRALKDSPQFFGSTYDSEASRPDEFWKDRAAGGSVAMFIAVLRGVEEMGVGGSGGGDDSSSEGWFPSADECLGLVRGAPCFHREAEESCQGEGAAGLYSM